MGGPTMRFNHGLLQSPSLQVAADCYYFPATARKLGASTSGRLSAQRAIFVPCWTICMPVKICRVIRWDDVIDKKRVTANYTNTPNCASFCLRTATSQREFVTEPRIKRLNCKGITTKSIKSLINAIQGRKCWHLNHLLDQTESPIKWLKWCSFIKQTLTLTTQSIPIVFYLKPWMRYLRTWIVKLKVELWTKERKAPIVTKLWCRLPKTVRRRLTTVVWKNTLALTPVRFHALTGPKIIRQRNQLFLTDMSIDKTYFYYQVLPCWVSKPMIEPHTMCVR